MFFPPRSHCPNCLGNDFEWVELHGESTLHSWTEISVTGPQFDTPLLLGLVDLPQGIGRIVARIVGTEAQQLKIGMPVKVSYADVHESFSLYYITTDQ